MMKRITPGSIFIRPMRSAAFAAVLTVTAAVGSNAQSSVFDVPALGHINDRTPDWLTLSGEFRVRYENRQGLGFISGNDDAYALARTRLNIGIRFAPVVQLFVQAQDSRAPGIRPGLTHNGVYRDEADLRQAYLRVGGIETSPVTLTVGRQLLLFGDQRLVGPLDWTNTARTWDAVRLELRPTSGMKFDVFSSAVVANRPGYQINRPVDGTNFHGVYGAIGSVIPKSTIEPFVFWRTASSVIGEDGTAGDMDKFSAGVRIAGSGLSGVDYSATFVDQWGDYASSDVDAWAYSLAMGYTFVSDITPRAYVEYNFGSGDTDRTDGRIGGFDDAYPTAHLYYGYNDLVGWRNLQNVRLGFSAKPHSRLSVQVDYHAFWLANGNDNLYNVAGGITTSTPPTGATDDRVGDELDVTFNVPISSTLSAGGGVGHMFPGPFLESNTLGAGNTFSFLFIGYKF
jgi:hypothetical protein